MAIYAGIFDKEALTHIKITPLFWYIDSLREGSGTIQSSISGLSGVLNALASRIKEAFPSKPHIVPIIERQVGPNITMQVISYCIQLWCDLNKDILGLGVPVFYDSRHKFQLWKEQVEDTALKGMVNKANRKKTAVRLATHLCDSTYNCPLPLDDNIEEMSKGKPFDVYISESSQWKHLLASASKKDDLADTLLQALAYYILESGRKA